ncbi:MAG TPA: VIT domain-containing protein, partial [Ignavibacteriaceae bacterium]|nr:VIT domain-containing protein [Ignavibacteriaceae bacterium]
IDMKSKIVPAIVISLCLCKTIFADGLIIIPQPGPLPTAFPLEVVYHHVDVKINGNVAETSVDQEFYNPTDYLLEGYYIFPIPKDAVIKNFSMIINGKETAAELLDAVKARRLYEDIVRQVRDPALLEYTNQGLFKVRVFPIEPRSSKKISIGYREILDSDNGMFEYIYPLNTEKFSAKSLKNVSINVSLKTNNDIKNIYSPTHIVDVVQKDNKDALISFEEEDIKPDTDFKLFYSTNNDDVGLSLLSYKEPGEEGYFFLTASPSFIVDSSSVDSKNITFVIDISGSMAGDKLKQAKRALTYCINNLNPGDGFDIIEFSTEAYSLFNNLERPDDLNIKKAAKFIEDMRAAGGTNIEQALEMAVKEKGRAGKAHLIVFITDGKPTIGETNDEALIKTVEEANREGKRIFTFGIGTEINTHLLDKITELTRAARAYISPDEDIELKISSFYDKVQSPVLTDLSLDVSSRIKIFKTYPKDLPDLFRGSSITVFGRYSGDGPASVTLSGYLKGAKKTDTVETEFTGDNDEYDFIPPIWASRRIGYLLDQIRLNGEQKEIIDEITELAREHGIVTPYTSYLIMEDEDYRIRQKGLARGFSTLPQLEELKVQSQAIYGYMKEKSGDKSIIASEELQGLNTATNFTETKQGSGKINYKDENGIPQNLSKLVKNIFGRAVYQNGKFWVDSGLQNQKNKNEKRIQFNSDEYFQLLKKKPETSQFLALGKNVRFYFEDTFYEIYE